MVAFSTRLHDDPGDTDNTYDIYSRDLTTGVLRWVSPRGTALTSDDAVTAPALSSDGSTVAFTAAAGTPDGNDVSAVSQDVLANQTPAAAALAAPVRAAAPAAGPADVLAAARGT